MTIKKKSSCRYNEYETTDKVKLCLACCFYLILFKQQTDCVSLVDNSCMTLTHRRAQCASQRSAQLCARRAVSLLACIDMQVEIEIPNASGVLHS